MDIIIYWHLVGREHGGVHYAREIRKNPRHIVESSLRKREQFIRAQREQFAFYRHDEHTLVERTPGGEWIVYDIARGVQYTRKQASSPYVWKIDIVDITKPSPAVYCVHDWFIDVLIDGNGRYEVVDLDEFSQAIDLGIFNRRQISRCMKSLHGVMEQLGRGQFPDARLQDIMAAYDGFR